MSHVVFARYRPGIVGETRRVCHVITLPDDDTMPESVSALCGQSFPPGVLEQLPAWAGLPCVACTLKMPTQGLPGSDQTPRELPP
jgi:hypothetical protein